MAEPLRAARWTVHGPSSEETPPTPSPPDGEDSALLRSFLLSPQNLRILRGPLCFFFWKEKRKWGVQMDQLAS